MQPIRVLHILHSMDRGGAENALMNYYRHINKEKVQFDFLLTKEEKCQFEEEILSMGGRIYHVPLMTISNPFPYLSGIKDFLKNHPEYRIVHSHTSSKSFFPLWIAKQVGVPVRISHSHSSMAEKGINGKIRLALRPLLKLVATDWVSCGEQAGTYLYGKKAMEKGKVVIFRNVIECSRYLFNPNQRKTMREKIGADNECFVIGHTARYDPVKNHKFGIDILVEIKKKYQNVKLLAVGLGVKEGVFEYAKKRGVLENIIFTGVVNNVWDYEQAMDAFILPSFNEGLPLSIIEAQVSGLPCFTTAETVSSECSVTNLVSYIPLNAGAKVWADKILSSKLIKREDRYKEVADAGYDAEKSAIILQNYYIQKYSLC